VLVRWLVSVVSLDDLVHEWSESVIGVVGTSIDTDTGVGPLGAREDTLFEGESELVPSIFALLPDVLGEALGKERCGSGWEVWHVLDLLWGFEVGSHHGSVKFGFSDV
jgi:hypothetical protein